MAASRDILSKLAPVFGRSGYSLWSYPEGAFLDPDVIARAIQTPVLPLKRARRRLVLRVKVGDGRSVVLKAFPLDLAARLRYGKYALQELQNYAEARARGVATPMPLAYFEERRFGLVAVTGLALEDLHDWRSFSALAAEGEEVTLRPLVVAFFARLFDAGANHIDTNPDNLLVSPARDEVRLIDWQYASFVRPRRLEQLVLQAGRFLSYSGIDAGTRTGGEWLEAFFLACRPDVRAERFRELVIRTTAVKQPYDRRLALRLTGVS